MAGALSKLRGYAQGGSVDPDDPNDYGPTDDGSDPYGDVYAGDPSEENQGALSSAAGPSEPGSPSEAPNYDAWQGQFAKALAGSPEDVVGALSRDRSSYDSAKARQLRLIGLAHERVAKAGQGNVNLPMLAAASALGGQANLGRGIAAAFGAAGQELQRGRTLDTQRAAALANLDVMQGNAGVQGAQADYGFTRDRYNLAREALASAARNQAYTKMVEARRQAQVAAAQAKIDAANAAAQQRADQAKQVAQDRADALAEKAREADLGRYTWQPGQGSDPADPTKRVTGMWRLPSRPGEEPEFHAEGSITGRGGAGGASGTALTKNAQFYVDHGVAPDIPTAINMLRTGVNDAATFQRLVQAEKKILQATGKVNPTTGEFLGNYTDAEAEQLAKSNVQERTASARQAPVSSVPASAEPLGAVGVTANTAQNPGFNINMPFKGAPGTARPAPAAVAPAPTASAAIPPRPAAVPVGAKWSPSQRQWWWKGPDGNWNHAAGGP